MDTNKYVIGDRVKLVTNNDIILTGVFRGHKNDHIFIDFLCEIKDNNVIPISPSGKIEKFLINKIKSIKKVESL